MEFKNAVANTPVFSLKYGFGVITQIKNDSIRGHVLVVQFKDQDTSKEMGTAFYTISGTLIGIDGRDLFLANDFKDMITENLYNDFMHNQWLDKPKIGERVFDLAMGWGIVNAIDVKKGQCVVHFPNNKDKGGYFQLTYNSDGTLANGKGTIERLFSEQEVKRGKHVNTLINSLGAMENSTTMFSKILREVSGSSPLENTDGTDTWLFFYQPKEKGVLAKGFCKNVMIGAGVGKSIREAFLSMQKNENNDGRTRLDILNDHIEDKKVGRIFAYKAAFPSYEDKEFLRNLSEAVITYARRNVSDVVAVVKEVSE
jgi:hypothetical protein